MKLLTYLLTWAQKLEWWGYNLHGRQDRLMMANYQFRYDTQTWRTDNWTPNKGSPNLRIALRGKNVHSAEYKLHGLLYIIVKQYLKKIILNASAYKRFKCLRLTRRNGKQQVWVVKRGWWRHFRLFHRKHLIDIHVRHIQLQLHRMRISTAEKSRDCLCCFRHVMLTYTAATIENCEATIYRTINYRTC